MMDLWHQQSRHGSFVDIEQWMVYPESCIFCELGLFNLKIWWVGWRDKEDDNLKFRGKESSEKSVFGAMGSWYNWLPQLGGIWNGGGGRGVPKIQNSGVSTSPLSQILKWNSPYSAWCYKGKMWQKVWNWSVSVCHQSCQTTMTVLRFLKVCNYDIILHSGILLVISWT